MEYLKMTCLSLRQGRMSSNAHWLYLSGTDVRYRSIVVIAAYAMTILISLIGLSHTASALPTNDAMVVMVVAGDLDGDGIDDSLDNCLNIANLQQRDSDFDGIGNVCDADLNNDCAINFLDLAMMTSVFFGFDPDADLNGDGNVNFLDLSIMTTSFFGAPGPSGLANNACPAVPVALHEMFPGTVYSVGNNPNRVAIGDFNNDGRPDVVNTYSFSSNLSVLLSDSDGGLGTAVNYTVGNRPNAMAIGDLNGDTILDIITANAQADEVAIVFGNGFGGFQAPVAISVDPEPVSVAIGDLNGDNIPDLFTTARNTDEISVLIGNGDGTFQVAWLASVGPSPNAVAVADLNDDSMLDVVTANSNNTVSVLLGNGEGGFLITLTFSVGNYPEAVEIADLNGDSVPDLVTQNRSSNDVSILLGNGDGSFLPAPVVDPGGGFLFGLAIGDMNADTIPDLVMASTSFDSGSFGRVSVAKGIGDGGFEPPQVFNTGARNSSIAIALGYMNGDSIPDVVGALRLRDTIAVWPGTLSGGVQTWKSISDINRPDSITLGDIDGDQNLDMVTTSRAAKKITVFRGDGAGEFQRILPTLRTGDPGSVAIADVNADNIADLVAANIDTNDVSVFLGVGEGLYQPERIFLVGESPESVAIGDINDDALPDIVTANTLTNDISILLGDGDGQFQVASQLDIGSGIEPLGVEIQDLNGDAIPDLIAVNGSGPGGAGVISVLMGVGNGSFQDPVVYSTDFAVKSYTIEDLDGDQVLDVAIVYTTGSLRLFIGDGDGGFPSTINTPYTDIDLGSIAVADLNGDLVQDLVATNRIDNNPVDDNVVVLLGSGDGLFRKAHFMGADRPGQLAVGDLNGDNQPDVVTTHNGVRELVLLLQR